MNIKVTVDYKNGYYYVTGYKEGPNGGEFSELRKVISGPEDDNGKLKYSYTDKKLIEYRKREMKATIKKIIKENPEFKVSKDAIKKVDLLMFIALKRWDEQINNNSNYATKYLMAVMQEFDRKNSFGLSKKEFNEKCRKARADSLERAGINITYNVGMIGADDNLSLLDRIIGIRIAKMQKKFLGAKVINKAIVNNVSYVYDDKSLYENLPNTFEIPEDFEDRIISQTARQHELQDEVKYRKEDLLEFDGEDDIVNEIAKNLEINRKNEELRKEPKKRIKEEVSEVIKEKDESSEEDLLEFDGEDDIVSEIAKNLKINREDEVLNTSRIERKKRIKAQIDKVINKKGETLEDDLLEFDGEDDIVSKININLNRNKENRVFNRQKIEQEKKIEEIDSSEIESLKQLKSEIKDKLEEIDSNEIASLKSTEMKQSEKSKEIASNAKIINEMAQKTKKSLEKMNKELKQLKEKNKKELESDKSQDVYSILQKTQSSLERINKEFEENINESRNKIDKTVVQHEMKNILDTTVEPIIDFTEFEKIENENNEKEVNTTTNKTSEKIIPIERGSSKKGTWTRKIKNQKDSIKNKKFNPNGGKFKERVVRVAISLLAAGSVAFAAYNATRTGDVFGRNNDSKVDYEAEYALDKGNDIKTPIINNQKTLAQSKVQTVKQTEKLPQVEQQQEAKSQTKTKKESEVEAKTEKEIEVETKTQIKQQQEAKSQMKIKRESEVKAKTEKEIEAETKTQVKPQQEVKTEEEKIEEFRQQAVQKYMDAFIIGEKPAVGDMLEGEFYSECPDGSGKVGCFDSYPDYELQQVTIMTPKGWYPESTEGKSLADILEEYPDYISYGIHFSDSETKGGLGFITETQLEEMINDKVNAIIGNRKKANTKKTVTQDNDER